MFGAAILAVSVVAVAAVLAQQAPTRPMPDPRFTPGAVVSTEREAACAHGHTPRLFETNRRAYVQQVRTVMALYGLPYVAHHAYEIDHVIPRCAGGSDEIANLWPEPLADAKSKDVTEREVCRAVCTLHTMTIEAGQQIFFERRW